MIVDLIEALRVGTLSHTASDVALFDAVSSCVEK